MHLYIPKRVLESSLSMAEIIQKFSFLGMPYPCPILVYGVLWNWNTSLPTLTKVYIEQKIINSTWWELSSIPSRQGKSRATTNVSASLSGRSFVLLLKWDPRLWWCISQLHITYQLIQTFFSFCTAQRAECNISISQFNCNFRGIQKRDSQLHILFHVS